MNRLWLGTEALIAERKHQITGSRLASNFGLADEERG